MNPRSSLPALALLTLLGTPVPAVWTAPVVFLNRDLDLPRDPALALQAPVCLRAALVFQGLEIDLPILRALSGEAWAPLFHAPLSVRQPLRELQPIDSLTAACEALGVEGNWHTGLTVEQVFALVTDEIESQRPVFASFLHRPVDDAGWNLIIGAETGSHRLMIRDERLVRRRTVVELTREWSGPVPGPERWVNTPLFTVAVSESSRLPDSPSCLQRSLTLWAEQSAVTEMPLPDHPGAGAFGGDDPAGEVAVAGPAAARGLGEEIRGLRSLDNFSVLWRVRALLPLLAERREAAATFLRSLEGLDAAVKEECTAVAESLEDLAVTARVAAGLMWDQSLNDVEDARDLLERVRLDPSLVIDLEQMPAHERALLTETIRRWPQPWSMRVHSTPWGAALMVDSPEQRERIVGVLTQLAEQMDETDRVLGELASMVGVEVPDRGD